jgi:hypothetical protein
MKELQIGNLNEKFYLKYILMTTSEKFQSSSKEVEPFPPPPLLHLFVYL